MVKHTSVLYQNGITYVLLIVLASTTIPINMESYLFPFSHLYEPEYLPPACTSSYISGMALANIAYINTHDLSFIALLGLE